MILMKLYVGPKPARDAASQQLNESMEKSRKIAEQTMADTEKADAERTAAEKTAMEEVAEKQKAEEQSAGQEAANQQRQVEILGQMFSRRPWNRCGQPGADSGRDSPPGCRLCSHGR